VDLTYSELRKIARKCLSVEHSEHTIQATALVHEAYLQLVDTPQIHWQDRAHFFAIVSKLMRRILIDHARARGCAKRGGDARRIDFEKALMVSAELDPLIVCLDEALRHLAEFDSRKAKVVEMRYFGGMTAEEIAVVLGVSHQTVNRDWNLAKAWLLRAMSKEQECGRSTLESN
jgi:RNA polymerase sigma factor (TIGR02999 family)